MKMEGEKASEDTFRFLGEDAVIRQRVIIQQARNKRRRLASHS